MVEYVPLLSLLLFSTKLNIITGVANNICQETPPRKNCDNIYIWRKDRQEFTTLLNGTFAKRSKNDLKALEGKTIRVVAHHMLPYILSSNDSNDLSGYLGEIWTIAQDYFKFKSAVRSISYDDGLEVITRGEADVLLAGAVEKSGLKNIEFSQPYFYNWYHLYIKKPEARASSSSYLRTLDDDLWVASVCLFLLFSTTIWLTARYLSKIKEEQYVSLPSCFLAVCGGFLNQGFDVFLRSYSCRIQLMVALVFGVLLYAGMNAGLVAKLAILDVPLPFTSLYDISQQRIFSLCLRTNSFVYNNFTYPDVNRTIRPEWKNIVNGKGCLNINNQENLAKILCKDNLIFLENTVVMSTVVKKFQVPCEIAYLNVKYFEKANQFIVWKHWEGKKLINAFVRKLSTSGVLQRLEHKWVVRELPTNIQAQGMPEVNIFHVNGIIYIYIVMIFVSLLMLLVEIWYFNRKKRQMRFIK